MASQTNEGFHEGGWGWVVVFAAFMVYFIAFGSLRCQSVLFVPIMDEFHSDYSSVGWVSATATGGLAISGIIAAVMMAILGHRITVMTGGLLACLASVASVFAPSVAALNVTAGLLTGIGLGISFIASSVMIGIYFQKRRSFATNLASMGASIGSFILCPLNGWLVKVYDIRGYYLILGGIFLQLSVAGALLRPISRNPVNLKEASRNSCEDLVVQVERDNEEEINKDSNLRIDLRQSNVEKNSQKSKTVFRLGKDFAFLLYCLSQMIFMAGFLTSQLYIVPFAEKQLNISPLQAPLIMSITSSTEILSRILFGILGDLKKINRLLMFACVLLLLSICTSLIPLTNSFATLAAVAAVTGLFQGGFSGISIVVLADIVGIQLYGTALGVTTLLNGIGTLVSPPLIGIAVNQWDKPSVAISISAGLLVVGAILTFLIEVIIRNRKRLTATNDA